MGLRRKNAFTYKKIKKNEKTQLNEGLSTVFKKGIYEINFFCIKNGKFKKFPSN